MLKRPLAAATPADEVKPAIFRGRFIAIACKPGTNRPLPVAVSTYAVYRTVQHVTPEKDKGDRLTAVAMRRAGAGHTQAVSPQLAGGLLADRSVIPKEG